MDICDVLEEVERRCPGGSLPASYIILDLETTGLDPKQCRALQYGLCIVKDGAVVDTMSTLLNYPYDVVISSEAAQIHKITPDRMKREGEPPDEFIPSLISLLKKARETETMFMGHNFGAFDRWIIERDCAEFGDGFIFGDNEFIDTGGLVKAAQLVYVKFDPGDTLASFFERVREVRAKGVRWSLSWCVREFGLVKEGVDESKLHDAGVDARTVHLLYQSFREQLRIHCAQREARKETP